MPIMRTSQHGEASGLSRAVSLDFNFDEWLQVRHDENITVCREVFLDAASDDHGCYAYTYYFDDGQAIYHGYTTNARQRAREHWRKAPWAGYADSVRYRKCSTPHAARKLERRLQDKIPSLCHVNGMTLAYHGADWSELHADVKGNHLTGHCKLPGGLCDADYWIERGRREVEALGVLVA